MNIKVLEGVAKELKDSGVDFVSVSYFAQDDMFSVYFGGGDICHFDASEIADDPASVIHSLSSRRPLESKNED